MRRRSTRRRPAADERRVWLRHPADLRTQVATAEGGDAGFDARVCDVSRGGVKLLSERAVDPGALLTIGLSTAGGEPTLTYSAPSCLRKSS